MTPGEEDDYDEVEVQGRVEAAAERIRGWGRAGEWREGEQWMEDALIGLVKGDKDMGDLPLLAPPLMKKPARTHKLVGRAEASPELVVGDCYNPVAQELGCSRRR